MNTPIFIVTDMRYPSGSNMEATCTNTCLFEAAGSKFSKLTAHFVILSFAEFQLSYRTLTCDPFISSFMKTLLIFIEIDSHWFIKIFFILFLLVV